MAPFPKLPGVFFEGGERGATRKETRTEPVNLPQPSALSPSLVWPAQPKSRLWGRWEGRQEGQGEAVSCRVVSNTQCSFLFMILGHESSRGWGRAQRQAGQGVREKAACPACAPRGEGAGVLLPKQPLQGRMPLGLRRPGWKALALWLIVRPHPCRVNCRCQHAGTATALPPQPPSATEPTAAKSSLQGFPEGVCQSTPAHDRARSSDVGGGPGNCTCQKPFR